MWEEVSCATYRKSCPSHTIRTHPASNSLHILTTADILSLPRISGDCFIFTTQPRVVLDNTQIGGIVFSNGVPVFLSGNTRVGLLETRGCRLQSEDPLWRLTSQGGRDPLLLPSSKTLDAIDYDPALDNGHRGMFRSLLHLNVFRARPDQNWDTVKWFIQLVEAGAHTSLFHRDVGGRLGGHYVDAWLEARGQPSVTADVYHRYENDVLEFLTVRDVAKIVRSFLTGDTFVLPPAKKVTIYSL